MFKTFISDECIESDTQDAIEGKRSFYTYIFFKPRLASWSIAGERLESNVLIFSEDIPVDGRLVNFFYYCPILVN